MAHNKRGALPKELPTGQISNQNWGGGNDYPNGYLFLGDAATQQQVAEGTWAGGVNVSTLRGAELRAFSWYVLRHA